MCVAFVGDENGRPATGYTLQPVQPTETHAKRSKPMIAAREPLRLVYKVIFRRFPYGVQSCGG